MEFLEPLLNFQNDLSERIFKARKNFKKSPHDRITTTYIETRIGTLDQLWSEFRVGHKELLQKTDPKALNVTTYIVNEVYDKTEEEFTIYTCELKDKLQLLLENSVYCSANTSMKSNELNPKSNYVRLPKITISTFSGQYTEWTTFHDLFVSMIHKNESLDNVQKLQYLKGYLTGEPEQLIRYIPVTEANYQKCWTVLKERYSNKKYISHCILERLLGQKNATSESASYLKQLIDTSSDCLNALTNLEVDVSTWDIILIHLLSLKLDPESRKQWELNVTTNTASDALPTFSQFKQFVTSRYRALEFVEPKNVNKSTTSHAKPASCNSSNNIKVLHATNVSKMSCELCNEDHKLCFCKKFTNLDVEKRHEFVTNNRLCYNCLGSNHGVRFCQKDTSCRVCKKRHHSLLHSNRVLISTDSTVNSGESGQTVEEVSGEVSGAGSVSSSSPITSHSAFNKCVSTNVLLATASVEVEARKGYQVIRALVDQGSTSSFVTEDVVQRLGLKKVPIHNVISSLGGDSMVSNNMVTLNLRSRTDPSFQLELRAYVLKNITTYLPRRSVHLDKWVISQHLRLADPAYDASNKIEMLLGADVYCQVLREGLLRGPMGYPVAQCTTFGWILSGQVNSNISQDKVNVLHTHIKDDLKIKHLRVIKTNTVFKSKLLTGEQNVIAIQDDDERHEEKLPSHADQQTCKKEKLNEKLKGNIIKNKLDKVTYKEVKTKYVPSDHLVLKPQLTEQREEAGYLPYDKSTRANGANRKISVASKTFYKSK